MHLICSNCGAVYRVDDKVIPGVGREVQCSFCKHTWFQKHAHLDQESGQPLPEEDATESKPDVPAKARRSLDPGIANVLREEAEHESEARKAEAAGVETRPDPGLDDTVGDAAAADRSRRERLPNIEAINSTLRASTDEVIAGAGSEIPSDGAAKPRRGGFRTGFLVALVVIAAGALIYCFAPQIVGASPQAKPYLIAYVDWVNAVRSQVNANVDNGFAWLSDMIGGLTVGES